MATMRTIKNLTGAPLRVSLPGGKTLHVGPGQSAAIRDAAAEHPGLKKLCESGVLELSAAGPASAGASRDGGGDVSRSGAGFGSGGGKRRSGDR
jgi:hypothetical protein